MLTDPFLQGWTNVQKKGTTAWVYVPGSPNTVRIREQGEKETECLFVSPKLNFAGERDISVSFEYRLPFDGTAENAQLLYTVDNGDSWKQFNDFIPQTGGSFNTAKLKIEDVVATNPNLQIAFKYKTTDIFPLWQISNITFSGIK